MDYTTYIQNFLAALQEAAPVIGIDYAEYISVEGESPLSLANKSYNREFTIVPFANLKDKILTEVS